MTQQGSTSISNEVYDIVSVVYHALQGAETYDKYVQDADADPELRQFFQNAKQQDEERARQGLQLLQKRGQS